MEANPSPPKHLRSQSGALCPSCERFIGPSDVCPYCGADSARCPILRHLRRAALFLAVTGVGALYLFARLGEPAHVEIGSISPAMNFAFVRTGGKVTGIPRTRRDGKDVNYVSFSVSDGPDRLLVVAEGSAARDLSAKGQIPADGEWVDVTGTLSVAAEGPHRLRLYDDGSVSRRPREDVSGGNSSGQER